MFAPALMVALLADAVTAPKAEPLDRVVAVIGDRPMFLSEVRQRARPHFVRMELAGASSAAAKSEILRTVLERMIEEKLEAREADRLQIGVSPGEVDDGMRQVATNIKVTTTELLAEAKRQGLNEQDYRDEIRRQILEGKLLQLRVRAKVVVGEAEARAAYASWVKEQRGANVPAPTFETVKEEMRQRAYGEALERERKVWLQELRKSVYVEVKS